MHFGSCSTLDDFSLQGETATPISPLMGPTTYFSPEPTTSGAEKKTEETPEGTSGTQEGTVEKFPDKNPFDTFELLGRKGEKNRKGSERKRQKEKTLVTCVDWTVERNE